MGGYRIHTKPEHQTWCLMLPNGGRYIGRYIPFTDPNLTEELSRLWEGKINGWIKESLEEDNIECGEPTMIYVDKGGHKMIHTVFTMRLGRILEYLVDTYCS